MSRQLKPVNPHAFNQTAGVGPGRKNTDAPGCDLPLELFRHTPAALVSGGFRAWCDGLTKTGQYPWRHRVFKCIQLLSGIAKEHPGRSWLPVEQRMDILHNTLEPMIQRELHHRGLVPEDGGYSAGLIGWVEIAETVSKSERGER